MLQCVRIHPDGRVATVYLKRRDLLRLFALDPRDLRRIDPNLQYTRSSPTLYVRDNLILAQLAGARLIITASASLLLDPHCAAARKLLGELIPKLQVTAGHRLLQGAMRENPPARSSTSRSHSSSHRHGHSHNGHGHGSPSTHGEVPEMPFELDVLEATLHVSISKLDAELVRAQALVQSCLQRLPRDITPQNLDELRKAKSALVELESKSDAYRYAHWSQSCVFSDPCTCHHDPELVSIAPISPSTPQVVCCATEYCKCSHAFQCLLSYEHAYCVLLHWTSECSPFKQTTAAQTSTKVSRANYPCLLARNGLIMRRVTTNKACTWNQHTGSSPAVAKRPCVSCILQVTCVSGAGSC